jgi:hypothetical protein
VLLLLFNACMQEFEGLPEEDATALLQLAMNSSNPSTAEAAAHGLPEQLEAAAARKLLLTAAVRQHTAVIEHVIDLPVTGQHIDADTLEGMIMQLLPQAGCLELLCTVPAAAQLSSEAAARLLLEGLKQRQHVALGQLWGLAGAQQISSELLAELLLGCAHVCTCAGKVVDECLGAICILPAATALSSTELVQLLEAVFERGFNTQQYADDKRAVSYGMTLLCAHLMHLPAAAELSTEQVMQLIQKAALFNNAPAMRSFAISKITGRLSSEMVLQTLQTVVEAGGGACTEALCLLPAAQQLGREAVVQLLQAAADPLCTASLCQLPAAQQLSSEAVTRLLQAAEGGMCTASLCHLPAARKLSCEAVAELLTTAVKKSGPGPCQDRSSRLHAGCISSLFLLPVTQEFCSATVARLLHAAAVHGSIECTISLCRLPGAAQISRAAVARLLQTSMQLGHHKCTIQLCELPAAQSFSREQVLEGFEMAVQLKCVASIQILHLMLPAAAQLSTEMSTAMYRLSR